MNIAIVSDIHGNLTALEAVLAGIRHVSPDLVLHGGDLSDSGSSPTEIVDLICDLGWPGVMGNTDEMLVNPSALDEFISQSSAPPALWTAIRQIAAATRSALGEERLAWMRGLPRTKIFDGLALVHAIPDSCWRAPAANATDEELETIYASLAQPVVVFGHTHLPAVRRLPGTPNLLINSGSIGLPYDGNPRASYLVLRDGIPEIRRVEYDLSRELKALATCGLPGAEWTAQMLRTSRPQMP